MKKLSIKKNKSQFISVLWLPFALLFLIFLDGSLGAYLFRSLSDDNISYILFTNNIFSFLFTSLIFLNFIILGFYFYKMLGKESDFSSRSLESNINSKKITRNCLTVCSFLIILSTALLFVSFGSRYEANKNGYYKREIFDEDRIIFEYDEVEAVEVFLEWVYNGKTNSGYETFVEIKTNGSIYVLTFTGFSKDYYYVDSFLSNFDDSIISIDKTYTDNTEEIIRYYEQAEIFNKIYKTK